MEKIDIRTMRLDDLHIWEKFAHDISDSIVKKLVPDISIFYEGFYSYMDAKIKQNEAYMAVCEATKQCAGIIAFSRKNNRITFFGVSEASDFINIGSKLIDIALGQLDVSKDITANVLRGDCELLLKEKKLYHQYGFVEYDNTIYEAGVPACMMKLPAQF